MSELSAKKCVPCEGGVAPLSPEQAQALMEQLSPAWQLAEDGRSIRHDPKPRLAFAQFRLSSHPLLHHCRQKQQRNRKNDEKYLN